jgi:predicted metal-dependent hydrolase
MVIDATEQHQITINGLAVEIVRKAIKNLHLGVYPPYGRVRVAAPLAVSDDAVRLAVIGKLGWIKRQQAKFEAQPRQSQREMVSGESHYFLGQRYRLRIIDHHGAGKVVLRNKATLELHVRPETNAGQREKALYQWYREPILLP